MSALADRLQARIDELEDQVRVLREALAAECAPLAPLKLSRQQEGIMAALMRSERVGQDRLIAICEATGRHPFGPTRNSAHVVIYHMRQRLTPRGVTIRTDADAGYYLGSDAKARVREICAGVAS